MRTFAKKFREQWNLLMGNKGENETFLRDEGNIISPPLGGPQ